MALAVAGSVFWTYPLRTSGLFFMSRADKHAMKLLLPKPTKTCVSPQACWIFAYPLLLSGSINLRRRRRTLYHFESQLVGCTITNDRRAAVGYTDDPSCRFCASTKESLKHIVQECPHAPSLLRNANFHELGPNFLNFGVVEHPPSICDFRLHFESWPFSEVDVFHPHLPLARRWTDGSVLCAKSYWATGTYAVVNEQAICISQGRVNHFNVTSYTTELYAVLAANTLCNSCIHIYTDWLTVVQMFGLLCDNDIVDPTWSHCSWWKRIHRLWTWRRRQNPDAIRLSWIKAHTL